MDKNIISMISMEYIDDRCNSVSIRLENEETCDIFVTDNSNKNDIIFSISLKELKIMLTTMKSDCFGRIKVRKVSISKINDSFFKFSYYNKDEDKETEITIGRKNSFKCFCKDVLEIIDAL